jgi:hypothetical protein
MTECKLEALDSKEAQLFVDLNNRIFRLQRLKLDESAFEKRVIRIAKSYPLRVRQALLNFKKAGEFRMSIVFDSLAEQADPKSADVLHVRPPQSNLTDVHPDVTTGSRAEHGDSVSC